MTDIIIGLGITCDYTTSHKQSAVHARVGTLTSHLPPGSLGEWERQHGNVPIKVMSHLPPTGRRRGLDQFCPLFTGIFRDLMTFS